MSSEATAITIAGRAALFGFVAAGLAFGAHWTAGGPLLSPAILLAIVALVAVLVMPLLRRERRLGWILAVLIVSQALPHLIFSKATHAGGHALTSHARPGVLMLALHALAVVVTAWWLRRGEAAFWARARKAIHVVKRVFNGRRDSPRARRELLDPIRLPHQVGMPRWRPLAARISNRGPPGVSVLTT